jgi:hypothetical protein
MKLDPVQICEDCGSAIPSIDEKCSTCGWYAGPPNVRVVERETELYALEQRYQNAIEDAEGRGSYDHVKKFDEKMRMTCAVINVGFDFLHTFITNDKVLYTTYNLGIKGQTRKPANEQDDRHRQKVEGTIFGAYGDHIRYAALSLDGAGVKSYGKCALKLREVAIIKRATLLENNSYDFIEKHDIKRGEGVPPGYRAIWKERHKLAVAKLAGRISSTTSETEYPKVLLFSEGKYETDDFVEVHIYGPFDANSIESVRGSTSSKTKVELALCECIKEHLFNSGKEWVEE